MNQISGEHAEKIYQDMQSCDGFLRHLQQFAEDTPLDEQVQGILVSDVTEMRSTISKWTESLRDMALTHRREKKSGRRLYVAEN